MLSHSVEDKISVIALWQYSNGTTEIVINNHYVYSLRKVNNTYYELINTLQYICGPLYKYLPSIQGDLHSLPSKYITLTFIENLIITKIGNSTYISNPQSRDGYYIPSKKYITTVSNDLLYFKMEDVESENKTVVSNASPSGTANCIVYNKALYAAYINSYVSARIDKLEEENNQLKAENCQLEEEKRKLEEQVMNYEYDICDVLLDMKI